MQGSVAYLGKVRNLNYTRPVYFILILYIKKNEFCESPKFPFKYTNHFRNEMPSSSNRFCHFYVQKYFQAAQVGKRNNNGQKYEQKCWPVRKFFDPGLHVANLVSQLDTRPNHHQRNNLHKIFSRTFNTAMWIEKMGGSSV